MQAKSPLTETEIAAAIRPYMDAITDICAESLGEVKGKTTKKREQAVWDLEGTSWKLCNGALFFAEYRFRKSTIKDTRWMLRRICKKKCLSRREATTIGEPEHFRARASHGRVLFLHAGFVLDRNLSRARQIIATHGTAARNRWISPTNRINMDDSDPAFRGLWKSHIQAYVQRMDRCLALILPPVPTKFKKNENIFINAVENSLRHWAMGNRPKHKTSH